MIRRDRRPVALRRGGTTPKDPGRPQTWLVGQGSRLALIVTLLVWRVRLAGWWLTREALRSIQGWGVLLVLAVAAPTLWELASGADPLVVAEPDGAIRMGVLLVSHLALTPVFAILVVASLLREAFARGADEPLLGHPWILPELDAARILSAIGWTTLYLLVFFHLFYLHLLIQDSPSPAVSLAVHGAGATAYFLCLGVAIGIVTRHVVARVGTVDRVGTLQRLLVIPFVLTFPLFTILPGYLYRESPELLAHLGNASPLHLLQLPLVLEVALRQGKWGTGLLSGGLAVVASLSALALLLHHTARPTRVGSLKVGNLDSEEHPSLLQPSSRPSEHLGHLLLFWKKDVELPIRRGPIRYLQMQTALLGWTVVAGVALRTAVVRDWPTGLTMAAGPIVLLMSVCASLAFVRTLPSLGMEGWPQWARLQTVLGPRRLLRIKTVSNALYMIPHAVLYALVLGLTAQGFSGPPFGWIPWFAIAILGATILSILGTSVGFLLPDFRCRGILLPGASLAAKLSYPILAAPLIGALAAIGSLWSAEELPVVVIAGLLGGVVLTTFFLSVVLAAWALRRLHRNLP